MLSAFDVTLGTALLWTAWRCLSARDLVTSVFLLSALGFLVAFAWVRLGAPDVALAEAAIGAGVTGALLLRAARRLEGVTQRAQVRQAEPPRQRRRPRRVVLAAGALALTAVLGAVVVSVAGSSPGLTAPVTAALPRSGVSNPVTAVLLNFRGYDTLLEVAVLLAAVVGVWTLGPAPVERREGGGSSVLWAFVRLVVPVAVLGAGYLLWVGGHAPGGAFQGGALLAGAAILLLIAAPRRVRGWAARSIAALRFLMVAGLAVFASVAAGAMAAGGALLEYPVALAKHLILLIEAAAMLSIAAILWALVLGGEPATPEPRPGGVGPADAAPRRE
jgi:multisubunit Na+/H+ antiporter MnhB subunit